MTNERKLIAFVASFFTILGFLIALIAKKDDDYVMHYAKQGLVVFLLYFLLKIFNFTFGMIPYYGDVVSSVLFLGVTILWLASWLNALSGKKRDVVIVSDIAKSIKL